MFAEIHGNNQGISKLYRPQDMGFNPKAGPLKFENETKLSVGENDSACECILWAVSQCVEICLVTTSLRENLREPNEGESKSV